MVQKKLVQIQFDDQGYFDQENEGIFVYELCFRALDVNIMQWT